jgi:hypothetical protein
MPTPNESLNQAFQKAVASIAPDIPFLMHGAGDVVTSEVNPATAQLVAALVVQYMGKLVDAAIDSHQMQQGGYSSLTLPAPSFPRSRQPPKSAPHDDLPKVATSLSVGVGALSSAAPPKRRRTDEEFWDEPLREPKIRNKLQESASQRMQPRSEDADDDFSMVHVDEWVGLAGVDLLENRARSAYVQGSNALSTQSFIFPICHDAYTFGRVVDVRSSRRSLMQTLIDPELAELVRLEGKHDHASTKKRETEDSDPEESDEELSDEEEREEPFWPGLEDVLPVHRSSRYI